MTPPTRPSRRAFLNTCALAGAGVALSETASAQAADDTPVDSNGHAWDKRRDELMRGWLELLGPFPAAKPELNPQMKRIDDIHGIECHYLTYESEPSEGPDHAWLTQVPAYLLIPEGARSKPSPAVITIHPTTRGSGKDIAVGLCGRAPGDPPLPPETSRAYGLELAQHGYITLSIDLICDGERIPPGCPHYCTTPFYELRPEWSAIGKIIWDTMRAVDFLHTLDFVDPARIAVCGHSLGGHSSLFSAAFDPRIAAAIGNGGVYSWRRTEDHWARPETQERKPVTAYTYIRKFRPYLDDTAKPVPADFDQLMMLTAPRPLLIMQAEFEFERDSTVEKVAKASEVYRQLGAGERITMFNYPGEHNYPPVAKRFSFSWLDRWMGMA